MATLSIIHLLIFALIFTVILLAPIAVILGLIFALRHRKYGLSFKALTVTSAVYGSFFLVVLFFFVTQHSL